MASDDETLLSDNEKLPSEEEIKTVVEKCYDELRKYDECYIDYLNISDEELQKNCKVYKSDKCQKYFEDPIKHVPTCSEAIGYKSVSRLNHMDLTISDYNEACGINNEEEETTETEKSIDDGKCSKG